jgi:PAS domain S-box-containing protein
MATRQEKKTRNWLWFAIVGLIFGVIGVFVAAALAVILAGSPLTFNNILTAIRTTPLLWLLAFAPLILAILLGYLGAREDRIVQLQNEQERLRSRYQAELNQIKSQQTQMAEIEETLGESREATQRRESEYQELQNKYAVAEEKFQQVEQQIGRGKRQWEATFDAVQDLILITDQDGIVVRCNQATTRALHSDYAGVLGKPVAALFTAGDQPWEKSAFQKTEVKFSWPEGWYEVTSSPLQLDEERYGNVYIVRNISERKQASLELQRQKQYYQTLFFNSPIAIVTVREDQTVLDCNPAFENLFGYSLQELRGQDLDQAIVPDDLLAEASSLTAQAARGEYVRQITRRARKDGETIDVEVFGIPVVVAGRQLGVLGMYHDLSSLPVAAALEEEMISEEAEISEALEEMEIAEILEEAHAAEFAERPAEKITAVEGIGPVYAEKLGTVGIYTTADLLEQGGTRKGREDLAENTGISHILILNWVNRADLMRVPGVGEEYSDLLEAAGVDSVKELRHRNPENLHQALSNVNAEKNLVRRLPALSEVTSWVAAAKSIPPRISY